MVYNGLMKNVVKNLSHLLFLALLAGFSVPIFAVAVYEAQPISITQNATFITEKSARLNGSVNPSQLTDTNRWFEWGLSSRPNEIYETKHRIIRASTQLIVGNENIIGLAPATQYFYRQVSENSRGKNYGSTVYFTTKPLVRVEEPIALASSKDAYAVGESSATLRGYVSPHGNAQATYWFEWGMTSRLENKTPTRRPGTNSRAVEERLTGLAPGTAYYFRIVAENSEERVVGDLRVLMTKGTAPSSAEIENRDTSSAPTVVPKSDDVLRKTTTSGTVSSGKTAGTPATSGNNLPGVSGGNRPGDFLGAIFGKKDNANTPGQTSDQSGTQVAGVAGSSGNPLGKFWDALTGSNTVDVTIEKVGPESGGMHTPVEYRVTYRYERDEHATNSVLKVVLPSEVIYIGDNTNNELMLEDGAPGGERTYVLVLGQLEKGSTRTLSILGMTTGEAKGFPDARARLEYTDASGTHVAAAGDGSAAKPDAAKQTASTESSSNGLLPSSLIGWITYVLIVAGAIFGIRKAKEYYDERRELINAEEGENEQTRFAELIQDDQTAPVSQ